MRYTQLGLQPGGPMNAGLVALAEDVEVSVVCVVSLEADESAPSSAAATGTQASSSARPRISVRKQTTSTYDVGERAV